MRDPRQITSHAHMRPAESSRRVDPRMLPPERRNSDTRNELRGDTRGMGDFSNTFPRGPGMDPAGAPFDYHSHSDPRYPGGSESLSPKDNSSRYDPAPRADPRMKRSDPRMGNAPDQRLGSDQRMGNFAEDYRGFPSNYAPPQDSDLRSGAHPPRSAKFQDTDLRMTPQSYTPPHRPN